MFEKYAISRFFIKVRFLPNDFATKMIALTLGIPTTPDIEPDL